MMAVTLRVEWRPCNRADSACADFASGLVPEVPALCSYGFLRVNWLAAERGNHRDELGGVNKSHQGHVPRMGWFVLSFVHEARLRCRDVVELVGRRRRDRRRAVESAASAS